MASWNGNSLFSRCLKVARASLSSIARPPASTLLDEQMLRSKQHWDGKEQKKKWIEASFLFNHLKFNLITRDVIL